MKFEHAPCFCRRRLFSCVCVIGLWLLRIAVAPAQQPAFPGAEGFGAFATGGRSGTVYHVTNLSDSGSGSFRDAVSAANRTIVFDVSGTINLSSNLSISKSNLTIAGQTAPGDGIAVRGWLTSVSGRNVIIRYIRCRPGDINCPTFQDDAFHFDTASNCIADHVSASWDNDEALSTTHSTNITVQWCMIEEPLDYSCHDEGTGIQHHGYGSLLRYGAGRLSFHHNLYAHCKSRNPRLGDNIRLDFVNNVIYNWGDTCGYNSAADTNDNITAGNPTGVFTQYLNYVNNYLIIGTSTTQSPPRAFKSDAAMNRASCQIYQSNNLIDTNKTGPLAGYDKGWASFSGNFTTNSTPFAAPPVTTDSPTAAFVRVLSSGGASLVRDAVDAGVVSNVLTRTGHIINSQTEVGGWPTLNSLPAPLDTDQDGMPDFWEAAMGSNTNNATDRNDLMPDGYTRLEWYLNWLAAPHALATNSFVDVELRQYTAGLSNTAYAVASPSNGVVTVLGDGHTARFTPTPGFSGMGRFVFTATGDPGSLSDTVSVLVASSAIAPVAAFTASPVSGTEPLTVLFTDASTGTPPLSLTWNLGDSTITNTSDGAGFGHIYGAGSYTVTLTASNSAGTSTLVSNNLIQVITAFQAWQLKYFNCTNCPQADTTADPDGDGQNNQAEFLSGTNPTNSQSALRIISAGTVSNDIVITWRTAGGHTNVVQATTGDGNGGYDTNFAYISGLLTITGSGDTMTNYVDVGGATNVPSRYYRVRVP